MGGEEKEEDEEKGRNQEGRRKVKIIQMYQGGDWGGYRGGENMRKSLTWLHPSQPDAVHPSGLLHLPPQ